MEVAGSVMATITNSQGPVSDERGFSLIEVLVAMFVLTIGLMPLAQLAAGASQRAAQSTPMLLAREKAREAIESVHAGRDTGEASWATIKNAADGGVFLNGAQPIKNPGDDGLVNTGDDGAVELPATMFTRQIIITPLNFDGTTTLNPNLRQIQVIVSYKVNQTWRTYTLTTYISSYS
jgi:prepilin-type N-terminal cleavage/methylation domain-containing protein